MTWEVLCKCSGKYIDIYFNLKITFLCSSISDKWQKTLKTPKKVAGRVGKEGVLGGVSRL